MPYKKIQDLPNRIKDCLPNHAQLTYLKSFNNALKLYNDDVIACKVAWSSVKRKYKKGADGNWIPK